jgi:2,3-bisphosphoglycerate-independent phosphoglycerate mutase
MSQTKLTTTLLVILDGWGVTSKKQLSAIRPETAPNFFGWNKKFPYIELDASGEAVGLFKGQEGNSEAGHLNIGAGRVVKQDAVYISDAIEDGTFFKNNAFVQAFHHVKKYKTKVHLMGLLSNHNSAHACPEHIYALLDLCRREGISEVYLHLFTDGRDSGVHDAPEHLKKIERTFDGYRKNRLYYGKILCYGSKQKLGPHELGLPCYGYG